MSVKYKQTISGEIDRRKEIRILRKHLERSMEERKKLKDVIDTQMKALKTRNEELESSKQMLEKSEAQFRFLSQHDTLTGLPNQHLLMLMIEDAIIKSEDSGRGFSIMNIELNDFNEINDKLGHSAGNIVLKEIAGRIASVTDAYGHLARISGYEFAVLINEEHDAEELSAIKDEILDVLKVPVSIDKKTVYMAKASIEISAYPFDENSRDEFLNKTDAEMYAAKKMKDRVNYFHKRELENELIQNMTISSGQVKMLLFEFDLTKNKLIGVYGSLPAGINVTAETSFDSFMDVISRHYVYRSRETEEKLHITRDGLIEALAEGKNSGDAVFRFGLPDGSTIWVALRYYLTRDKYTGDVIAGVTLSDIDKVKEYEDTRKSWEETDNTTGLYKIKKFAKCAEKMFRLNEEEAYVLIMIGIKDLSRLNEKYGYIFGDEKIGEIAASARRDMNRGIGGRIGADVIFLIGGSSSETRDFAAGMYRRLQADLSREIRGHVYMGAAEYPKDDTELHQLLFHGKAALDQAMKNEEKRTVFYNEIDNETAENADHDGQPLDTGKAASRVQENDGAAGIKPSAGEPARDSDQKVFIRTFGYFDVFVEGRAIHFRSLKAKEMLAVLVDRRGGFVSQNELISCLWEDESSNTNTLSRCRKVFMRLKNELAEYGIEDILESSGGERRICPEKIKCDYYDYLDGSAENAETFKGAYMNNYAWSEETLAELIFNH